MKIDYIKKYFISILNWLKKIGTFIAKMFVKKSKVMYKNTDVDISINNPYNFNEQDRKEFLKQFNLKEEDYIFLNVGNLNKDNNQILQIEAVMHIIPEYKNIKLLIVGDGPLDYYYNHIILKYGLTKNIQLIEEKKDIDTILNYCDCFLATNKKRCDESNIIRAMFANKPIIASRIKEHRELLEENNLVNLNNADELITKLERNIILGKRKVYYDIEKYKSERIVENK